MKSNTNNKFKIELGEGVIYLDRGEMGAVLIENKLNYWINGKAYEDLGIELVYGWKGYQVYSDEELIDEIGECFVDPNKIKKLLTVQKKRLKLENAEMKKEGLRLLKEIKEISKNEA